MRDGISNPDEASFSFQNWPFYWLARANGAYLQNMETALRELGLDIPRWRVLMTLHHLGCASVSMLAEHAIAKLPTMMRIVQRMQSDGLVSCRTSDRDARVTEVMLTEQGRAAGHGAWQVAAAVYHRAFHRLSRAETNALNRLLQKVSANLAAEIGRPAIEKETGS
jgi:DNA-binding MarR family transcriptional regulator